MIASAVRGTVTERARHRCEYCGCPSGYSSSPYAIEHIHPSELGGSDDLENLAWSCAGCNGHKAIATHAHDPLTRKWVPLFHPRRQH